jgi:hypothetical protein
MRLLDLCLIGPHAPSGEPPVRLGVSVLDEYLSQIKRGRQVHRPSGTEEWTRVKRPPGDRDCDRHAVAVLDRP